MKRRPKMERVGMIFISLCFILIAGCAAKDTAIEDSPLVLAAHDYWSCFQSESSACFYEASSEKLQGNCDEQDTLCKATFGNLKGMIIGTRSNSPFEVNQYDLAIESETEDSAVVHYYVPKDDTEYPIKVDFVKEHGSWKADQMDWQSIMVKTGGKIRFKDGDYQR